MAALALVGALMTGCSSEDDLAGNQQPENKNNLVTLTTTVSLDGGATTRALTTEGVKTFAEGETMAVIYSNGTSTVKAVSHALEAGDITNGGKNATFTFDLETPNKSASVLYIYPAAMAGDTGVDMTKLNTQEGTFDALQSKYDLCTKPGAWDGENLPSLTLENRLAILAITLKDNAATPAEITNTITGMTISIGAYNYSVTRDAASGPIYVAILPTSDATIDVTATDGSKNYTKSLTNKTYEEGNGYNVSWRMTEVPNAPEGAISGQFSVSGTKKVYFSKGNLQATTTDLGSTWTWAFAENQWDYIGGKSNGGSQTTTGNNFINGNGTVSANGTVDLFGWSTSVTTYGMNNSTNSSTYSGNFVDWGATMGTGWFTLSSAEWTYLFNNRSASTVGGTSNGRYAKAFVNDVRGVILFPDTYTHPNGVATPTGVNATGNTGLTGNDYSSADWAKMESAGCVFLPAAGDRNGWWANNAGSAGCYWSSSPDGGMFALRVYFNSSSLTLADSSARYWGYSVRLVREVE